MEGKAGSSIVTEANLLLLDDSCFLGAYLVVLGF